MTGTSGGDDVNLTGQVQSILINLNGDTASASSGLTAPRLIFIGPADVLTLGSGKDTIEFAMTPSSGIETIANFKVGQDELNIDMIGSAARSIGIYDTTVGGMRSIAISSISDITHGIVLLNVSGTTTAADLLANHMIFSNGHALII